MRFVPAVVLGAYGAAFLALGVGGFGVGIFALLRYGLVGPGAGLRARALKWLSLFYGSVLFAIAGVLGLASVPAWLRCRWRRALWMLAAWLATVLMAVAILATS